MITVSIKKVKRESTEVRRDTYNAHPQNDCLGKRAHRIIPGSIWLLVLLLLLLLLHLPGFFLLYLQKRLRSTCGFADIPPA